MAATLEKIRMPSTTTTPVDSWAPTPSLSPRKTISRGDQHVADERDDEDLVVEDAVEEGAEGAEDGVERRDDRDRQVGLQRERHVGGEARARATTPTTSPMIAITACLLVLVGVAQGDLRGREP